MSGSASDCDYGLSATDCDYGLSATDCDCPWTFHFTVSIITLIRLFIKDFVLQIVLS